MCVPRLELPRTLSRELSFSIRIFVYFFAMPLCSRFQRFGQFLHAALYCILPPPLTSAYAYYDFSLRRQMPLRRRWSFSP